MIWVVLLQNTGHIYCRYRVVIAYISGFKISAIFHRCIGYPIYYNKYQIYILHLSSIYHADPIVIRYILYKFCLTFFFSAVFNVKCLIINCTALKKTFLYATKKKNSKSCVPNTINKINVM